MKGVSLLDFPIINQNRADTVDRWQSTCEALGSVSTVPEEQRWKAWVWGVCRRKCEHWILWGQSLIFAKPA